MCVYAYMCIYIYVANENITSVLNFFLHLDLIILMPFLLSYEFIFNQIVFGVMKLVCIEGHRFYLLLTYFKDIDEDIAHYTMEFLPYNA